MNRLKSALIVFFLLFMSVESWADSIMPPQVGGDRWLKVSTLPTWGSLDNYQVVIFEIPASTSGNLYFGIHSPACDTSYAADEDLGAVDETNIFHLVGDQALSNGTTRNLTFSTAAEAIGTGVSAIQSRSFLDSQANGDNWFFFNPVTVDDGEQIGSKVYFKIVAEIPYDVGYRYKNGFQVDVFDVAGSDGDASAPVGGDITDAKSFAFSISYDLSEAGDHYFYPFVSDMSKTNLVCSSNDGDSAGWSYVRPYLGTESAQVAISGNNEKRSYSYAIGGDDDQTWRNRINLPAASANNTTEFWYWTSDSSYTNDTVYPPPETLIKIYSEGFENAVATLDHVIIDVGDGAAAVSGTQRINFQIVDSSGDAAPYSRSLTVGLTGSASISDSSDGDTNTTLVTDTDGFGWIDITDAVQETVTVTINWTIAQGFPADSSDSDDVMFADFTWLGVDTTWANAANWSGGAPPTLPAHNAIIPSGTAFYPILTADVSFGGLLIQSGANINLGSSTLTLAGDLDLQGSIGSTGAGAALSVAGATCLAGDITSDGNITLTGDVKVGRNVTLDSGDGNISFGAALDDDGYGPWSLTLDAGTGDISVTGATGGSDPLSALTISDAGNATFTGAVTVPTITQTAGSGTTQFSNTLSTTAAGGIDLNGAAFTFNGAVTTSAAGPMTITNSGLLTIADAADPSLDGAFIVDGNGNITLAGDITTNAAAITFDGTGNLSISDNLVTPDVTLTSGGADIQFDGDLQGAGHLSVSPGAGNVSFTSTIGSGAVLSGLTVSTTGDTGFASTVAVDDEGLDVTTATGSFSGAVTTTNAGAVSIDNSGLLTAAAAADFNLDGSFTQTNTGALQLACDITTTGDNISFANAVTLTGNSAYDTGTGVGGNISFTSTIDGAFALVLDAGDGTVSFGGAVGFTTPLSSLDITTGAALALPYVETSGALDVAAAGTITDTTTLTIGGTMDLDASSGGPWDITLDDAGSTFGGTITIASANNATLIDGSATLLGACSVSGLFDVTSDTITVNGAVTTASLDFDATGGAGEITDGAAGSLAVTGTSTLAAQVTDNITLDAAGNDFTSTITLTSGNNITLVDSTTTLLGAGTVSGLLDVSSDTITVNGAVTTASVNFDATGGAGDITDGAAGSLSVTGTSTLAAQVTDDITLDAAGNDFTSTITLTSGNNITLVDSTTTLLGAGTVSGLLDVSSDTITVNGAVTTASVNFDATGGAGDITDGAAGSLSVTGTSTLAAQVTDNITLDAAGNDFTSTITLTSGNNITLVDSTTTLLGAGTVSGLLDVTSDTITVNGAVTAGTLDFDASGGAGNISDGAAGSLGVTGAALFIAQATDDVLLDAAGNSFGSTVSVTTANNITLVDSTDMDLGGPTSAAGLLDVTSDAIVVSGAVSANSLDFDASGGAGTITDTTGSLDIATTSIFTAQTTDDIFLDAANDYDGAISIPQAQDATIYTSDSVVLGTIGGSVSVRHLYIYAARSAAGGITQTGVITLTGDGTFDLNTASGDINIATQDNDIDGDIIVGTANNVANLYIRNIDTNAAAPTLPGTGITNLTLEFPNTSITLPALSLGGTLDVEAGEIEISDVITVNAADLDASVGAGNIWDSTGSLSVTTTLALAAQVTDDIILDAANTFGGTITIASANNATLIDGSATLLGACSVSGLFDVTSDTITVNGAVTTASLDFDASGGAGEITDGAAGSLAVTGTSTLAAQVTDNITLDAAGNDFTSTITLTSGNNITLVDSTTTLLGAGTVSGLLDVSSDTITVNGAVTTASVNFDATGGAGDITDGAAGSLSVTGTSTLAAQVTDDITLDAAGNDFTSTITLSSGNNITLVDSTTTLLGAGTVSGLLDVTSDTITVNGAVTTASVNFDATGGAGDITDGAAGSLSVTGTSTLAAQVTDDITLDAAGNDFTSTITLSSGNNITLVDSTTTLLGAGTVSGLLDVTSDTITVNGAVTAGTLDFDASGGAGNISDGAAGSLGVTGAALFIAQATDDVLLDAAGNSFGSTVSVTTANNITLVDSTDMDLGGPTSAAGLLDVTSDAIVVSGAVSANSLDFDASGGAGTITDSTGTLTITSTSILRANGTDVIQLDGNNDFGAALSVTNCDDLIVNDANTLDFGAVTTQDLMTVTAGGDITDSGTQTIGGLAGYTAPNGADIILDDGANSFAANVTFSSGGTLNDVTVVDTTAFDIQPMTIGGDFYLTCGADVTQTGILTTGSTAIDGAGTNVTLGSANSLGTLALDRAGGTLTVVNDATLDLGTASGVVGITGASLDLDVTSGNLTDATATGTVTATSASFDVAGTIGTAAFPINTALTNLEAEAGDDIYFSEADAVNIGGVDAGITGITTTASSGLISLVNAGAGTIDINEMISSHNSGNVTLSSLGDLTIDAEVRSIGTGSISLSSVGNTNLGADVTTGGAGSVTFNNAVLLSAAGLDVNATGTGNISFLSTVDNTQNLTMDAGLGDVSFAAAVGSGTPLSALSVTSSGNVITTVAGATIDAASVSFISTGDVTLAGDVSVSGAAGFTSSGVDFTAVGIDSSAGTGSVTVNHSGVVTLDGALVSASGAVDIDSTGSNVALNNTIDSTTGSVTLDASGSITVAAAGDITTTSGSVTFGTGTVTTSGDVATTLAGGTVFYTNALTLAGNVVISAADDVTFNSTVNADLAASLRDLSVAGDDILFSQNVGASEALNSLVVTGASTSTTANGTIDADTMTITGGGDVDLNGAVTTPSGFSSSGDDFDNTGAAITSSGFNITINHSDAVTIGAALSTGAAVAGNIDLDSTVGVGTIGISAPLGSGTGNVTIDSDNGTTVAAASDITTAGGSVTIGAAAAGGLDLSSDITTVNGDITCQVALTLNGGGTISFDSDTGATGDISFGSTVNATAGEDLVVDSGTADVYFQGIIGGAVALAALDIDADDVELYSIGTTGVNGISGNLDVASANGIVLDGGDYNTGGSQVYNSDAAAIRIYLSSSGEFRASSLTFGDALAQATANFGDIYLSFDTFTLTLYVDITCGLFAFFDGTLNMNGHTIATTNNLGRDFVVYGAAYDEDDPDWSTVGDTRFEYPDRLSLAYEPASPYSAAFADLNGSTITVGTGTSGDFYVNGTDMTGTGNWTLNVRDNAASFPKFNNSDNAVIAVGDPVWGGVYAGTPYRGSPYNVAFNMNVQNSQAAGGSITAASAEIGPPAESNNNVTDGGGNTAFWDFQRPDITTLESVWDNVLHIVFSEAIENSNGELDDMIGASLLTTNSPGAAVDVLDIWTTFDPTDGTLSGDPNLAGDLTEIYLEMSTTWNTDADGGSAGLATSSDAAGANRSITPDLSLIKSLFYDAGGKNPIRNYGNNGYAVNSSTADKCPPLLVAVRTDQYNVNADPYGAEAAENEYHNYMDLYYSEEVQFTDDTGTPFANMDFTETETGSNVRNNGHLLSGSDYLGHIPDVTGSAVTVQGLLTYDGVVVTGSANPKGFSSGSHDATDQINTLNRFDDFHLRINIASYYDGAKWGGYLGETGMDLTQPATFTSLQTLNVRDSQGNTGMINSGTVNDAGFLLWAAGAGWDVDPPGVAEYTVSGVREIIPLDEDSNSLLDRFEYHLHDDFYTTDGGTWDSETDHPDGSKGIRDSSLIDFNAFTFESAGTTPISTHNSSFITAVTNDTFQPLGTGINVADDPYFSILMGATAPWDSLTNMWSGYDEDTGFVTDLAGNRLRDYTELCVEYIPPEIDLALCAPGNDWIYIRFSEPVYGNQTGTVSIDAGDLYYSGGSLSISSLSQYPGGITDQEFILQLDDDLIRNDIFTGKLYVNANSIYDADGNSYRDTIVRRISDLGLDIVEPIWASDGIHDDDIREGSTLQDFDGTGRLLDRDITLQARINASVVAGNSMRMYYDANVSSSKVVDDLWLPNYHVVLAPTGNYSARYLNTDESLGNGLNNFVLPASDDEMEDGNTIEFIFMIDGLPCVRMASEGDIWSYEPWSFDIDDIREQKGGVTILNNIINPNDGDKAVLMYDIPSSGVVTAQIFSLNGSLVKILHRGRQAAGSYQYTWDGRNHGGHVVARGIYFVRVVGPDTDEIRKIMVVK